MKKIHLKLHSQNGKIPKFKINKKLVVNGKIKTKRMMIQNKNTFKFKNMNKFKKNSGFKNKLNLNIGGKSSLNGNGSNVNQVAKWNFGFSQPGSYMSFRRFMIKDGSSIDDIIDKCDKEFVPILKQNSNFISYYAFIEDNTHYCSVSMFRTKESADESAKTAAEWTSENLEEQLEIVKSFGGKTLVHHDLDTEMTSSFSE